MLISVHDKTLQRVAFLDNDKPETAHFYDDEWHRYLVEATSTFDFKVPKVTADETVLSYLNDENYISFRYEGQDYLFNIMKVVDNEESIEISTENLNLELISEVENAHAANGAHDIVWYLEENGITNFGQITIGTNEVADRTRTLSWEGTDTKLNRALSIVNGFDAECEFVTHLNRDGTLRDITLNIYIAHDSDHQGVGARKNDTTLYYRKDLKGVTRTVDKTGMYTAIEPVGDDNLNITSVEDKTVKDENGNVLFYHKKGSPYIFCPSMKERYPSQIKNGSYDNYVCLHAWFYSTSDTETLYSKGLAKLRECYQPAITYEAESTLELGIGDTVKIHDDGFSPTLLLEARVSEQIVSFSDPSKNQNKYSNAAALKSGLSVSIQERTEAINEIGTPEMAAMWSA